MSLSPGTVQAHQLARHPLAKWTWAIATPSKRRPRCRIFFLLKCLSKTRMAEWRLLVRDDQLWVQILSVELAHSHLWLVDPSG